MKQLISQSDVDFTKCVVVCRYIYIKYTERLIYLTQYRKWDLCYTNKLT